MRWSSYRSRIIFIHEIPFENTVYKISASLFRRQFVDGLAKYMNTYFISGPVSWAIEQDNRGCSNDCAKLLEKLLILFYGKT